jgi:hypothetical protein
MGFKMNGSPAKMGTIQGTAGHSSALKMKAEADAASALKQMTITKEDMKGTGFVPKKGKPATVSATGKTYTSQITGKQVELDPTKKGDKAVLESRWKKGDKASGGTLNELVKQRKGVTKGTPEYNKIQNQINAALGSKKRYDEGPVATEQKTTTTEPESKRSTPENKYGARVFELTPENKAKETVKIVEQKNVIKDAKTEQKNKRDEAQLEIGLIKSGRDDEYTGTMLSRALARGKVKRNTRQLKNRAAKNASTEQTAENTTTTE